MKFYMKKIDSKYEDYREVHHKEKANFNYNKLNILPTHERLSNNDLNETQMDYDATSLYPSDMMDEKSVYPEIEVGYSFKPHMNDTFVNDFKIKNF